MNTLLYKHENDSALSKNISRAFEALGLNALFGDDACEYFTTDPEIIRSRLEVMRDIIEVPGVMVALEELFSKLKEYTDYCYRKKGNDTSELISQLSSIRIYFGIVDSTADALAPAMNKMRSEKLKSLAETFIYERRTPEYIMAKKNSAVADEKILGIKSITIGINLSSNLKPTEAGLVSINNEYYKSGSFMDKLLRLDFKKNDYNTIAPITTVEADDVSGEMQAMMNRAILRSMDNVLSYSLNKISVEMKHYIEGKLCEYYTLSSELKFLIRATGVYRQFKERNIPVCYPEVSNNGEYKINGIINHRLALTKECEKIVRNNVVFDETGKVYVLTGPNSGGKTVYVNAVGAAQLMFQLGMPVLAENAVMPIVDGVFLQFPQANAKEMIKNESGRLEEECREISGIMDAATENSLILFDETFSSTNSKDSIILAVSTVKKLSECGCRSIFSTHIHELVDNVNEGKAEQHINGVDLLAAEIYGGIKTYRIIRGRAEKTGDALTIAQKYGII